MENIEELKQYKELLDSGVITQSEFDEKKAALLNVDAVSGTTTQGSSKDGVFGAMKQVQDKAMDNKVLQKINKATGYVEPTEEVSPKSKTTTALLSLIPGMGFAYLENYKYAGVMWVLLVLSLFTGMLPGMIGANIALAGMFGFANQGSFGGTLDRMLVDGKGRKLVSDKAKQ
ncbi:SHOCT domain-containing protein [Weissella viridescens]|uniref:SHOCT domain-containing protein n=1 Tax=Weissella viridescens TaxID=1629 RepID=UPI001D0848F8|nr:SHOCT domain-containing protein [Weissella viridescens]MCB6840609.1 SHOCT domain-containing protein [Weissella viridescens]MCB6847283.1 SHOCT domain-containing protein [Weissella viridescens]